MLSLPRSLACAGLIALAPALHAAAFELIPGGGKPYAEAARTSPGAALFFCSGAGDPTRPLGDTHAQALAAMDGIAKTVRAAGLSLSDVAFVRGMVAANGAGKVDFDGWNRAYAEFWSKAGRTPSPARTTIGVPTVGGNGYLIEIEFVCVTEAAGALAANSAKLHLPATNPRLAPYGTRAGRIYDAVGVLPDTGLFWTPGTGKPLDNPNPDKDHSHTYVQAMNDLKMLQDNLATAGLGFGDVVYLRAILGPDPTVGGKFDFDGWNRAYLHFFNSAANPHKPARTTMTTPVFGGNPPGTVEIEILAAFPGASPVFDHTDAGNANLRTTMSPKPPWADSVAAKPGASLYISSGIMPEVKGPVKDQALSILRTLKERLAAAGLDWKDVAHLHAYVIPEADGLIDWAGWSAAYQTYFNNPAQPHKPTRTTFAVAALPHAGQKIEIDVIAAAP